MTTRSQKPFPTRAIPSHRRARTRLLALWDERGVAAVTAAALLYLALDGGSYGPVPRQSSGVVVWLLLLAVLIRGGARVLPRGPVLVVGGAIAAFVALTGVSIAWSESAGARTTS